MENVSSELRVIPIDLIVRGRYQPRVFFSEKEIDALADSIKSVQVVTPPIVRPVSGGSYELVGGERRWRAAQRAGLSEIECIVRNYTDEQAAEVSLIDNIQREDLSAIEEAQHIQRLMREFDHTEVSLGEQVGKSKSDICHLLRLLQLPESVQEMIVRRELKKGHGKVLLSAEEGSCRLLAEKAARNKWSVSRLGSEINRQAMPSTGEGVQGSKHDPDTQRALNILTERYGAPVDVEKKPDGTGRLVFCFYSNEEYLGLFDNLLGPVDSDF
ncbi:hypothetical protein BOW53_16110 [Solemya pervernicosa gill symbiont]|uniref:Probable chromosome-partitioning protein ParB n=1 Tax=Solemya pervernicosa gill symbiont TaxID=642797 RepID=A0A1T2KZJ1_9GAMM|nr:ParB/RepB/Spo0J family partition protein [Solemya pervernicosa gill symbiont]OOZ38267.1 hypothetical protein BOW53_16110 [Solemya pervernicosa gill symbiont]